MVEPDVVTVIGTAKTGGICYSQNYVVSHNLTILFIDKKSVVIYVCERDMFGTTLCIDDCLNCLSNECDVVLLNSILNC